MIKRLLFLLSIGVSCLAQTSPTIRVNSLSQLQSTAIPTVSGSFSAIVGGTSTNGDQLGGVFIWNAMATDATNGNNLNKVIADPFGSASGRWIIVDGSRYVSSSSGTAPTNTITGTTPLTQNKVPKIDSTGTNLINSVITETNGLVGVNITSPPTEFSVATSSSADPRGIISAQYSDDTLGSRLQLRKSRGTVTSPTTIVSGDTLGRIRFSAWDGSDYRQTASIDGVSSGTIGTNRVPSIIQFLTSADTSNSTPVVAMTISTNSYVGIGTTSPYDFGISIGSSLLDISGITGRGLLSLRTSSSVTNGSAGTIQFGNGINRVAQINTSLVSGSTNSGNLAVLTYNNGVEVVPLYCSSLGNVGINTTTFGTSANIVLALGNGTAPSTSPSSEIQMWSANRDAAASTASLHVLTETGHAYTFGDVMIRPGGTRRHYTAATAPYAILITDDYIYNGSTSTNTFPAASTLPAGSEFTIFAGAGVTVTVSRTGGDTINGAAANDTINANTAFTYVSDGVSNFQRR